MFREKGKDTISKKFANKNKKRKTDKASPEYSREKTQGIANQWQPAEEERPAAVFEIGFLGLFLLPLIYAEDVTNDKMGTPDTQKISGTGTKIVSKRGS